jgi:hypothetical protein
MTSFKSLGLQQKSDKVSKKESAKGGKPKSINKKMIKVDIFNKLNKPIEYSDMLRSKRFYS